MTKLIEYGSVIGLGLLCLGALVSPASPLLWLASASPAFVFLRLCLIGLVVLLIKVGTPSSRAFRMMLAGLAAGLWLWAASGTYAETLAWLDGLSLMSAGTTIALLAIEPVKLYNLSPAWYRFDDNLGLAVFQLRRRAAAYALAAILLFGQTVQNLHLRHS